MLYLVLACSPDLEPLRYELTLLEAVPMARFLRSVGWAVTVHKELPCPA